MSTSAGRNKINESFAEKLEDIILGGLSNCNKMRYSIDYLQRMYVAYKFNVENFIGSLSDKLAKHEIFVTYDNDFIYAERL